MSDVRRKGAGGERGYIHPRNVSSVASDSGEIRVYCTWASRNRAVAALMTHLSHLRLKRKDIHYLGQSLVQHWKRLPMVEQIGMALEGVHGVAGKDE